MKASEVREAGFYWARDDDAWETVKVTGSLKVVIIGKDDDVPMWIFDEYVGPLVPPA